MPEEETVQLNFDSKPETKSEKVKGEAVAKKELKTANFEVGELVSIKDGIHSGEEGIVKEMDYSKGVALVSIEMFGRYTTLEMLFENVEPVKEY
jgi:transcriptional antiterminator NusG